MYYLLIIILAPTAAPTNLQASNTSSTSLLVTWNPPPLNERHGIIREYTVQHRSKGCGAGAVSSMSWVERTVNVPTMSIDITTILNQC